MLRIKGKLAFMGLALGLTAAGSAVTGRNALAQSPGEEQLALAPQAAKDRAGGSAQRDLRADMHGDPLPEDAVARLGTRRFRLEDQAEGLAYTTDGKSLVCYTKYAVVIWDAVTGQQRHRLHVPMAFGAGAMDVSPDGTTLAVSEYSRQDDEAKVGLWELRSGKKWRTLSLPRGEGPLARITHLRFACDGKSLSLSSTNKGKAVVFDLESGQVRASVATKGFIVRHLAISPDSTTLAVAAASASHAVNTSESVQLWGITTGKLIRTIHRVPTTRGASLVEAITFSPDGKVLAFSIKDRIFLYHQTTGNELGHLESMKYQVTALAFTPDAEKLISSCRERILVWNMATGKILRTFNVGSSVIAVSPDGKTLACGSGGHAVKLWDLATGKELFTEYQGHDSQINSLDFSPDGKTFVSAGDNEALRWDMASNRRIGILPGPPRRQGRPSSLAADGKTVFAVQDDRDIVISRAGLVRKRVIRGHEDETVASLSASPDARVLASGIAGPSPSIRLSEVVTGNEIRRLLGHQGRVAAVAWSPNNRVVASGEQQRGLIEPSADQAVRLWDTVTGKELECYRGLKADVTALTFSPDGSHLVAGLRDTTIVVWDVTKVGLKLPLAPELGVQELEALWSALAGDDAGRAYEAIWALAAAPRQSVSFLQDRLKPVDGDKIQRWLVDIDSNEFATRQTAIRELANAGEQARWAMETALARKLSLETHRRIRQLLNNLPDVPGPGTLRTIRAIMALERIGSMEAKAVLEKLSRGAPQARNTEESKATLERLAQPK